MNKELNNRLKQINIENMVFIIFIIIILLAYYANDQEIDYFLTNNSKAKDNYYYLTIIIFIIVVIISAYYFYQSLKNIEQLKNRPLSKEKEYANLDLLATTSALIAGLIYLYIAITDKDIIAEISL